MKNKYDTYDQINTTAVCWLRIFSEKFNKPLCITDFNRKDKGHLWLLEMFKSYSLYNDYCDFYINGNFFNFLYLKFFKRIKHLKYSLNKNKVKYVSAQSFIRELTTSFGLDTTIVKLIYNAYYW